MSTTDNSSIILNDFFNSIENNDGVDQGNAIIRNDNDDGIIRYVTVPLTDTQEMILSLLPIPACLLSILGSATIIYMACHSRRNNIKRERDDDDDGAGGRGRGRGHDGGQQRQPQTNHNHNWTPYTRLLIGLSCTDIIFSTGYIFWSFFIPQSTSHRIWAIGNDTTCSMIGFLAQFSLSTMLYNGMLSYYFVLSARYGYTNQRIATTWYIEPAMHCISLGYPLLTASIGSIIGVYKEYELGIGCWVKDYPDGCGTASGMSSGSGSGEEEQVIVPCKSIWIAYLFGALILVFSFVSIMINNIIIWKFVRQQTIVTHQMTSTSTRSTTSYTKNKKKKRKQNNQDQDQQQSQTNHQSSIGGENGNGNGGDGLTTRNTNNNEQQPRLNVASLTSSATTIRTLSHPQLPKHDNDEAAVTGALVPATTIPSSDGNHQHHHDRNKSALLLSSQQQQQQSQSSSSSSSFTLDGNTTMNETVGAVVLDSYSSSDDTDEQQQQHQSSSSPTSTTINSHTQHQHHPNQNQIPNNTTTTQQQQLKRLQLVSSQALLYVIIFFIGNTWSLIIKVLESFEYSNEQHLFPLLILQAWFFPLQGFFNFFVYVRPKYMKWRSLYPEESKLWSLQQAMLIGRITTLTNRNNRGRGGGRGHADGRMVEGRRVGKRGGRDNMDKEKIVMDVVNYHHHHHNHHRNTPSQATVASSHKTGKLLFLPGMEEEEDKDVEGEDLNLVDVDVDDVQEDNGNPSKQKRLSSTTNTRPKQQQGPLKKESSSFWDTMSQKVHQYNDSCELLLAPTPRRMSSPSLLQPEVTTEPTATTLATTTPSTAVAAVEKQSSKHQLQMPQLPPRRLPRDIISSITDFSDEEEGDDEDEEDHLKENHFSSKIKDEWMPPPLQPLQMPRQSKENKEIEERSKGGDDDADGSSSSSTYEELLHPVTRQEPLKGGGDEYHDGDNNKKKDDNESPPTTTTTTTTTSSSSSSWKWPKQFTKNNKKMKGGGGGGFGGNHHHHHHRGTPTSSLEMISELTEFSILEHENDDEEEDAGTAKGDDIIDTIDDGEISIQSETSSMRRVRFRGMEEEEDDDDQIPVTAKVGIDAIFSPPVRRWSAGGGGGGISEYSKPTYSPRKRSPSALATTPGILKSKSSFGSSDVDLSFDRIKEAVAPLPMDAPIQRPMRQNSQTRLQQQPIDVPIQRPMRQLSTTPDVPMDTPIQRPMRQSSTEPRYNIPQQRNGSSGELTMTSTTPSSIPIILENDSSSIAQTV